jgi:hypothetical protein
MIAPSLTSGEGRVLAGSERWVLVRVVRLRLRSR